MPNSEVLGLRMGRNGRIRPTEKSGPPRKVDWFFRNFSGWTEPIHSGLDRNFRKFWLNESRPIVYSRWLPWLLEFDETAHTVDFSMFMNIKKFSPHNIISCCFYFRKFIHLSVKRNYSSEWILFSSAVNLTQQNYWKKHTDSFWVWLDR